MLRIILAIAALAFSPSQSITISPIDFYGYGDLDLDRIRTVIPLREGDRLSRESKEQTIDRLKQALRQATGRTPSDVTTICCDELGRLQIYVGLAAGSTGVIRFNPAPHGSIALNPEALRIYREANEAWSNAMERGVVGEDDSKGYALSNDPQARAKQLALHKYAMHHVELLRSVLESAEDAEQRQTAAEMLGYASSSRDQIAALVHASRDSDSGVRNNAIRALGVIARSKQRTTNMIPAGTFVELLNSGIWTDRNKTASLLASLTEQRDPKLLAQLRTQALKALIEMARWHSRGHADTARLLLGRIAGIEEKRLIGMLQNGEVDRIVEAASQKRT
jgi:HEAT repeats